MALEAAVGSFAQPTVTGNMSITGLPFAPKVLLLFGNHLTADGVGAEAIFHMGVGVSSADRRAIATSYQDNLSSSYGVRARTNAKCLRIVGAGSASVLVEADVVSLNSDGATLSFNPVDAMARVINYVALGGSTLTNVASGSTLLPTTTGDWTVSGVGFQPDCVLFFYSGFSATEPLAARAAIEYMVGWAAPSFIATASFGGTDNDASPAVSRSLRTDLFRINAGGTTSARWAGTFSSVNSDGFVLNVTTAGTTAVPLYWLALKGGVFAAGTFNQPASTGNQTVTTAGVAPAVVLFQSRGNVSGTTIATGLAHSFGAAQSASARGTIGLTAAQATAPTQCDSNLDRTKAIALMSAGNPGTVVASADAVSLGSGAFTLNWGTVDATARQIVYLAIGNPVTAPFPPWPRRQNTLVRM